MTTASTTPCAHRDRFDEFKATGRLPSPKGVAFAILDLTQREDVPIDDLVRLIQSDPAIAGRILKFSNSAHRVGLRPIVSLSRAVIYLGIFRVRQLVLGFSLVNGHMAGKCAGFDYARFWSHSLATAIAAQECAPHAQAAAEESFTCGLLSGVGRLALATVHPEEYSAILAKARDGPPEQLLDLECAAFDLDHTDLTASLLKDWGLPDIFVDAVRWHESPEDGEFTVGSRVHALAHALHFSSRVARACVSDGQERWRLLPELHHLGAQLGIEAAEVAGIFDRTVAEWQEWGPLLNVPTQPVPPLAEVAASGPPLPAASDAGETVPATYPLRILAATPDAGLARHLENSLQHAGHAPLILSSEPALLAEIKRQLPQVLLLDWDMPNAWALINAVRAMPGGRHLYLIALAGAQQDLPPAALDGGLDELLGKPFSDVALLARLRSAQRMLQLQEEIQLERESAFKNADTWAHTNRRLLQEALTDPLTRLPNRRYGMDRLAQETSFAQQSGLPLACLMVDIDHFKAVNDQHGHDVGDQVLRQLADVLARTLRRDDVVFRYGGEEFLVICPATTLGAAALLGDRVRQAVAKTAFGSEEAPFSVTISLGAAVFDPARPGADEMPRQADQALYAAKQGGRNRVVAFKPGLPPVPG